MISVFVVVDVCLYRDGIVEYLERQDGVVVVGSAARLDDSLDLIRERRPDVVLVDTGNRDAIPILRQTCSEKGGCHALVLAVDEQEDAIVECAQLGAAGYVSRTTRLESLLSALESITRDEMICSPRVAAMLFRRLSRAAPWESLNTGRHPRLSGREREILELIGAGFSNKQIAKQLSIELSTVKNHVHHILRKLGVNRRFEAVERVQRESRIQVVPTRDS
jgi:two-component system, NarL family, nitrate/nitrite response regulator NarL